MPFELQFIQGINPTKEYRTVIDTGTGGFAKASFVVMKKWSQCNCVF